MKSPITTHVLDTMRGRPAEGIRVSVEKKIGGAWMKLASGKTNADGRIADLLPANFALSTGTYRMRFETAAYFKRINTRAFYPSVDVTFEIKDVTSHYHIPLLLSPFGYSTYRGS
jgi:5-hydroxyisourate hydrolase